VLGRISFIRCMAEGGSGNEAAGATAAARAISRAAVVARFKVKKARLISMMPNSRKSRVGSTTMNSSVEVPR
jgi:hypothetical protein